MNGTSKRTQRFPVPLLIVMSLMFFWNMSRNINDILIPHLKRACQLTDLQSSLVQSAFFGAYFLMALPAGMYIQRKGYKAGMIAGLLIALLGAALFYPAAETRYYPLFLGALFIMAAGFTFLEVTATPYISKLGDPDEASSRLSLSAAMGSVGATIAPYIGSLMLLHKEDIPESVMKNYSAEQLNVFLSNEASLVKLPYISLALLFLAMSILLYFIKLPSIKDETPVQHSFKNIFNYPHTLLGVLSVLCYLGAEVGIVSFLIRYSQSLHIQGLTQQKAALFISLFMGLVLIGRLGGAYVLKKIVAPRMLLISAGGALVLVFLAILANGYFSMFLLSCVGLFTSVMYPVIFTLSIRGLGSYTKTASSLLIMGIVGGALVPPLMGYVSDKAGIRWSFIFPMICYLYVIFYAISGHQIKNKA
ncbi:L-fucose:H+ symporter permease [Asinibacterium sp. OR53]|uniref:L-fucose:H+ symporter permease n=1 Tax=Asinibacterium sp. OR53 TaxID=925409 RepID=UPI000478A068|nr:L-fucose:H+ symporter permease [Asinibacterium sp. OR53]